MAPRASWKGYLKLSLVSCPIALYPAASSSERVSFSRINKKTGNRLKQQLVDAETSDVVDKEDIGRGYEIGKGQPPGRGRRNREDPDRKLSYHRNQHVRQEMRLPKQRSGHDPRIRGSPCLRDYASRLPRIRK